MPVDSPLPVSDDLARAERSILVHGKESLQLDQLRLDCVCRSPVEPKNSVNWSVGGRHLWIAVTLQLSWTLDDSLPPNCPDKSRVLRQAGLDWLAAAGLRRKVM